MGCTSDEPYLSFDKAILRIYARIMNKELLNPTTKDDFKKVSEQTSIEQDNLQKFNDLFKTKYEFKYDEFDRSLGKIDWDTYIDNIYEKRKDYLKDLNMVNANIINVNITNIDSAQKLQNNLEENKESFTNLISNNEKDKATIELLRQIYNLVVNRIKKTYIREFMDKLIYKAKVNITNTIETNEIITISSDEEDIKEIPNDNKNLIDTEQWTFQYQDARMFGIDTEDNFIDKNEIEEYLKWIESEINTSNDKEYKLSLILQWAYSVFNPNSMLKSISFGIEIYFRLKNTIFENYIEDIVIFYTNFNLEQILLLKDYEIFRNKKLNEWLTKQIDKYKIMQQIVRISISPDSQQDTKNAESEESSEKMTEAK